MGEFSYNNRFCCLRTGQNPVALALTMSGILVQEECLLNTIEVGTGWTCKCQVNCVGKSVVLQLSQQGAERLNVTEL